MSRTVATPLHLDGRGRLAQTDRIAVQRVIAALLPSRTSNPFDGRDGLWVSDPTWSPANGDTTQRLIAEARRQFDRLDRAGIAALVSATPVRSEDGTITVRLIWEDKHTGETDQAVLPGGVGG